MKSAPEGLTQVTAPRPGRKSPQRILRNKAISRVTNQIEKLVPWLTPADRPLLRAFAELERLAAESYNRMRSEGLVRADGQPHQLLGHYRALRQTQAQIADRLGLNPAARAALSPNSAGLPLDVTTLASANERIEKVIAKQQEYKNGGKP